MAAFAEQKSEKSLLEGENEYFLQRFRELQDYGDDWDGEGAKAINSDLIQAAREVVDLLAACSSKFEYPEVFPTQTGGVLLDWKIGLRSLEAELNSGGWTLVGSEQTTSEGKAYFTGMVPSRDLLLTAFYRWLTGEEKVWPSQ